MCVCLSRPLSCVRDVDLPRWLSDLLEACHCGEDGQLRSLSIILELDHEV